MHNINRLNVKLYMTLYASFKRVIHSCQPVYKPVINTRASLTEVTIGFIYSSLLPVSEIEGSA
jgi:hypothetical protein